MLSTKDLVLMRTDPLHLDLRCMVIKKVQQNLLADVFGHSMTGDAFIAIELDCIKFICICVIRYFLNYVLVY